VAGWKAPLIPAPSWGKIEFATTERRALCWTFTFFKPFILLCHG
jgi:hypothetical protein